MRRLRAAWRLLRCLLHGLHGVAIVVTRFESLPRAEQHRLVKWWAAKLLRLIGIELRIRGEPQPGSGLLVLNHVSWLDIMVVHAALPEARFVSKADVKAWPLAGRLADAADTLYLQRERKRDALRVVHAMAEALRAGDTVAIFPEGTTSTGHGLLPFHANLLQAAVTTCTPVQPAALRFADRTNAVSPALEFVGETTLVQSLWRAACGDGVVAHFSFLPPHSAQGVTRRQLADALRADVAAALDGVASPLRPGRPGQPPEA